MPGASPTAIRPRRRRPAADALRGVGRRPFGFYLHVPFCATRCGYCDFNTYTAGELGGGASRASYADTAVAEIQLARARARRPPTSPVSTVFVGGGTPTLLPPADLADARASSTTSSGWPPGAEVTTEANPESVTPESLARASSRRL